MVSKYYKPIFYFADSHAPCALNRMSQPESLTDALQSQVTFYKGEYENLKLEVKTLISENAEISKQLEELAKKNHEEENLYSLCEKRKEAIQALQKQLTLIQKEKDSFASLWRTSENTIKSLENELKTYRTYHKSSTLYPNTDEYKHEFSSVIKMLESKLATSLDENKSKEERVRIATQEIETLQNRILEKDKKIDDFAEKQREAAVKIENLEKEISHSKNELSASKHNVEALVNKVEINRQNLESYMKKEFESRNKVAEALRVVDAAISERDLALEREKVANDESSKLSKRVTEILNQSTVRIEKEIDIAKQSYNDKLNEMLIHIQQLELELSEKNLALDRAFREYVLLEERYRGKQNSSTNNKEDKESKILLLEQKFEATFQQLILSERRNIQIVSEKENLQMDFDQLTNTFQRDKRKKEWEEKIHSNEINSLKVQISNLKDALDEAHQSIQKLQSDIISKEDLQEKLTSDRFLMSCEFERHFETQKILTKRWKESMKDITSKLELKVEELLKQVKLLKEENALLRIRYHEDR